MDAISMLLISMGAGGFVGRHMSHTPLRDSGLALGTGVGLYLGMRRGLPPFWAGILGTGFVFSAVMPSAMWRYREF